MSNSDSPFVLPGPEAPAGSSAEELFGLLSRPDRTVQQLWSHQADTLRLFHEKRDHPDVAIELPTGSGKTLIALLIAEWTRRSTTGRILYLCPDNALVGQVVEKAHGYGISAVAFTGSWREYDPVDLAQFNGSQTIGVTSYWTIFNAAPRLAPTHLFLDDAHSAGPAISSNWNVEVARDDHPEAYHAIVQTFSDWIGSDLRQAIGTNQWSDRVEMVPVPILHRESERLSEILDAHLPQGAPAHFSWMQVRDNLAGCSLFISQSLLSIRPIVPPTHVAAAFRDARQRVYLSATLGGDGDLERTVGRSPIHYVPSSLQGSVGRRFILFGDAGLDDAGEGAFLQSVVRGSDRSIALTTSERSAEDIADRVLSAEAGRQVLRNRDIREGYSPFTEAERATLILANRYDGLDLPGGVCRLLMLFGLPSAGDLQERYLWNQLGAHSALWGRITTRISQGLGRTARGFQDYTLALLYGADLLDFVTNAERLDTFNPVLATELAAAREQVSAPLEQRLRAVAAFRDQDDSWQEMDQYLTRRAQSAQHSPRGTPLAEVASDEVAFAHAMWDSEYSRAAQNARDIVDRLDAPDLAGYKAWWCLQLSAASYFASLTDSAYTAMSLSSLEEGSQTKANGRIFAQARFAIEQRGGNRDPLHTNDEELEEISTRIIEHLTGLGFSGPKFEARAIALLQDIARTESSIAEPALEELGNWLGFNTWRPNASGSPDTIWYVSDNDIIAFEAKTEKTNDVLTFDDLRQAGGHEEWLRGNDPSVTDSSKIKIAIVSPCARYDGMGIEYARNISHYSLSEITELARSAVGQLRLLRQRIGNGHDHIRARAICIETLGASSLEPRRLLRGLGASLIADELSAHGSGD